MAVPVREEAKGIYRLGPLDTGRPSANTSPFLVVGEKCSAVVEPGEEGQVPQFLEGMKQIGVSPDKVAYVIASHIHLHHVQGVPMLLKELPNAKFAVHPRGAPHMIEPTRLWESTFAIFGPNCYKPVQPVPADRVMMVNDNEMLDLGGRQLQVIWTPGHAPHHICMFDTLTKTGFPGDAFTTGEGSFGRPGKPGESPTIFNPELALASMYRLRDLKPTLLLTFGNQRAMPGDDTLRGAEAWLLATWRICLEGLRQKVSLAELDKRCDAYMDWTRTERQQGYAVGGNVAQRDRGAPPALIQYLLRQDSTLQPPAGAEKRTRTTGEAWREAHPKQGQAGAR